MGAADLRLLNLPRPIEVAVDAQDIPRIVRRAHGQVRVTSISEVWRVEDGWWRDREFQIRRLYFELVLENGALLTLYRDVLQGTWHEQRA